MSTQSITKTSESNNTQNQVDLESVAGGLMGLKEDIRRECEDSVQVIAPPEDEEASSKWVGHDLDTKTSGEIRDSMIRLKRA